jgi:hypothetical protein
VYLSGEAIDYALGSTGLTLSSKCALTSHFVHNVDLLRDYYTQTPCPRQEFTPQLVLLSCIDGVPPPQGVDVGLHPWLTSRTDLESLIRSWQEFVGPFTQVKSRTLPGHHFMLFMEATVSQASVTPRTNSQTRPQASSTTNEIVAAIKSIEELV